MSAELMTLPSPIHLRTNADWRWVIHLSHPEAGEEEAEPLDLTGAALRMHIRRRRDDPNVLLDLSSANGRIVVLDAVEGKIAMNVDAAEIRALIAPGDYWCDLHVKIGDIDLVAFERPIEVIEGVTR